MPPEVTYNKRLKGLIQFLNIVHLFWTLGVMFLCMLALCNFDYFADLFSLHTKTHWEWEVGKHETQMYAATAFIFGLIDIYTLLYGIYYIRQGQSKYIQRYATALLSLQLIGIVGLMKMNYFGVLLLYILFRNMLFFLTYRLAVSTEYIQGYIIID